MNAALVISARDNVATALEPLEPGRVIQVGGRSVQVTESIPRGHKIALHAIPAGEAVVKYGSPIGTASMAIGSGAHVHIHNVASARGRGDLAAAAQLGVAQPGSVRLPCPEAQNARTGSRTRTSRAGMSPTPRTNPTRHCRATRPSPRGTAGVAEVPMTPGPSFLGYPRRDGRVGVRNHVLVVPTVICSAVVAERIAASIAPVGTALPHLANCGQLGPDLTVTHDTLAPYCHHPNVGAVIVVALGCEQVVAQRLADTAERAGKPVQILAIQSEGGTVRATAHGIEIVRAFADQLARVEPEWCHASSLILSVKCGGSDYTSGLASNPVVGRVADRLADLGGSVVLGEIAEIMGAEHLLAGRASTRETASKLLRVVTRVEAEAISLGLDIRGTQPSPGNVRGGLTTIEEKSLGATHKAGERTRLEAVVGYSAPITSKGLTVMDTPGLDVESVTGMVGGGAQVVLFTTGLGTPTGDPVAPVIKITGNPRTASTMADNIDVDVSGVMAETESLDAAADRLFADLLAVCSGTPTAAERLGHREFAIHRRNPTI